MIAADSAGFGFIVFRDKMRSSKRAVRVTGSQCIIVHLPGISFKVLVFCKNNMKRYCRRHMNYKPVLMNREGLLTKKPLVISGFFVYLEVVIPSFEYLPVLSFSCISANAFTVWFTSSRVWAAVGMMRSMITSFGTTGYITIEQKIK